MTLHHPEEGIIVTDMRLEKKYSQERSSALKLVEYLKTGKEGFFMCYPSRKINTIYLDSPDMAERRERQDPDGTHYNLRLRWYGENTQPGELQVELKIRNGQLGWKRQQLVALPFDLATTAYAELLPWLCTHLKGSLRDTYFARPIPAMLTTYDHDYYATPDGVIRFTVDNNVTFSGQLMETRLRQGQLFKRAETTHLEFKCPPDDATRLTNILAHLPLSGIGKSGKFNRFINLSLQGL